MRTSAAAAGCPDLWTSGPTSCAAARHWAHSPLGTPRPPLLQVLFRSSDLDRCMALAREVARGVTQATTKLLQVEGDHTSERNRTNKQTNALPAPLRRPCCGLRPASIRAPSPEASPHEQPCTRRGCAPRPLHASLSQSAPDVCCLISCTECKCDASEAIPLECSCLVAHGV